jgi:hypothetical protein
VCPLECNRSSFAYSLSQVDILGDLLVDYINENANLRNDFANRTIDSEVAKHSVARLTVFSDTLAYTESTESPKMDLVSLLANIGGHMGLFLNIGFFSLCEIFTVVLEVFFVFREKSVQARKCLKN